MMSMPVSGVVNAMVSHLRLSPKQITRGRRAHGSHSFIAGMDYLKQQQKGAGSAGGFWAVDTAKKNSGELQRRGEEVEERELLWVVRFKLGVGLRVRPGPREACARRMTNQPAIECLSLEFLCIRLCGLAHFASLSYSFSKTDNHREPKGGGDIL